MVEVDGECSAPNQQKALEPNPSAVLIYSRGNRQVAPCASLGDQASLQHPTLLHSTAPCEGRQNNPIFSSAHFVDRPHFTESVDVVRAVREPSEAMIKAGMAVAYDRVIGMHDKGAWAIFQAMIDAATKEIQPGRSRP